MKVLAAICAVLLIAVLSNYAVSGSSNTTEFSATSSNDTIGSSKGNSTDAIGSSAASSNDTIANEETSSNDTIGSTVTRAKISSFVDKITKWLKKRGEAFRTKCMVKLEKGQTPSADQGDSPLKVFGYPEFNEKSRSARVVARIPLTVVNRFPQPIKIGKEDYVFAGSPEDVLTFCACFEKFKVIGSSLADNGHWKETGNIKIQMQNVADIASNGKSAFDILFKYTLDRIIKYLEPVKIIKGMDCQILGSCSAASSSSGLSGAFKLIKPYLPFDETIVHKILEIYKKKTPLKDKVNELTKYITQVYKRRAAAKKLWSGLNNVDKRKRNIMVTLTMYDKPENKVRTTYIMGGAQVTMQDVGEAIKIALDK